MKNELPSPVAYVTAKLFSFVTLLLLTQLLYAQKRKFPPPPPRFTQSQLDRGNKCAKTADHSVDARMKNYPFNLAAQIQFVSFDGLVKINESKEFIFYNPDPGLLKNIGEPDTPSDSLAKEIKQPTPSQINKLTDILYNYGFAGPISSHSVSGCYNPRNAILFRDGNGKGFAFIELCFECSNTRESSEEISLGEMCNSKLDMIKKLFREAGIKYGIE